MSPLYRSQAKINLHLEVLGRRDDGYHELRTVFQSVDLADTISLEPGPPGVDLRVPAGGAPEGEANLAHRAATLFLDRWAPGKGARIELAKQIPVGGGLGGGSSNAATVLLALRAMFEVPKDEQELLPLARMLGADVPYFLVGGTALGVERGDRIKMLPDLPEIELWLATPAEEVSTAEVFRGLGEPVASRNGPGIEAWLAGQPGSWAVLSECRNDLEEAVLGRYPAVRTVYNALLEAGASPVRLSGSGSTLFARFGEPAAATRVSRALPRNSSLRRVRTLTRAAWKGLRIGG